MPPPRNDIETTTTCPICGHTFTPIRRQRYCTSACRQASWRARHDDRTPPPAVLLPPRTHRRDKTVYQCPNATPATSANSGATNATNPVSASTSAACAHTATNPSPSATSPTSTQHPSRGFDRHEPSQPADTPPGDLTAEPLTLSHPKPPEAGALRAHFWMSQRTRPGAHLDMSHRAHHNTHAVITGEPGARKRARRVRRGPPEKDLLHSRHLAVRPTLRGRRESPWSSYCLG